MPVIPALGGRGRRISEFKASLIYKVSSRTARVTQRNPVSKKWGTELNKEFSLEELPMAEKHPKECSTSSVIREIQIKTTLIFHFTPVRMAKIKNSGDIMCW